MCAAPLHDSSVKQRSRLIPAPATLAGALILLGFVAFVQWYIGWPTLLRPWTHLSAKAVVVAAALMMSSYGVRAVRLYDYFRPETAGRFVLAVKLTLQHNLWNNLLPMRSGEASFPLLMRRYFDIPLGRSLPALLWFRVLDVHTLAASAVAALGGLWLNGVLAVILTALWMTLPWAAYRLATRGAGDRVPATAGPVTHLLRHLTASLPPSRRAFCRAWAWTLVNWAVKFTALVWLLRQFLSTPLAAAVLGVIAGDATSVLPIHGVAGAGTYEAGIVAGMAASGAAFPAAAALGAAVNVHLFILGAAAIGGGLSVVLKGKRRDG